MSLTSNHLNVVAEVDFELLGERGLDLAQVVVDLVTGLPNCFLRLLDAVRVHLELNALLERVRFFVACESHMGVSQQLMSNRVAECVILLTNKNRSCVLLALVVNAFDKVSLRDSGGASG